MALEQWAIPELSKSLPLDEAELRQIITYTNSLSPSEAAAHLQGLLGDEPGTVQFISEYRERREASGNGMGKQMNGGGGGDANGYAPPPGPPPSHGVHPDGIDDPMRPQMGADSMFHPGTGAATGTPQKSEKASVAAAAAAAAALGDKTSQQSPAYAPPSHAPPTSSRAAARHHTNPIIEAGKIRAKDEQEMQNALQTLQLQYQIYNPEIEPEHEADYYCNCPIHIYQRRKWQRYSVQEMWSQAVMYPGEKSYNDLNRGGTLFSNNPYAFNTVSPYGNFQYVGYGPKRPQASSHASWIHATINLNNKLNKEAQAKIDAREPRVSIWDEKSVESVMVELNLGDKKRQPSTINSSEKRPSLAPAASATNTTAEKQKSSKFSSFRKSIGIKNSEERAVSKAEKVVGHADGVKNAILTEEQGRWPDEQWRWIVSNYQEKTGMTRKIGALRLHQPIQYLHLLRAGYFEPIPVAWANQNSNPLKFSIEATAGWRGITPAWRGYEDTAEERLYWVLNHREGSTGSRLKPDFISAMDMARARMASAVEPPPQYFSANDTCHVQHTSEGYSKQVMPPPFHAYDRPADASDDTMILLDVSGSMDFDPVRPNYNQYLITNYARSTQPKNKDVAKAIVRRFTDAMSQHDHTFSGYDLITFSSQAKFIGTITHQNLEPSWREKIRFGGGTRVMTGWQMVKERHFQKHSESATHHPIYGWIAGPNTPMLRLLLLLDGEATDMDEFELDLLGLSWAHVTIFLIGVDGCPHHHRHANELQRISDVNHHVSFVDAQGNTPERFVTHELLKRHLGYDMPMREFEEIEQLPAYEAVAPGVQAY